MLSYVVLLTCPIWGVS